MDLTAKFVQAVTSGTAADVSKAIEAGIGQVAFNEIEIEGFPLVVYAVENTSLDKVKALGSIPGLQWNRMEPDGYTALMSVTFGNQVKETGFLLSFLSPESVNARNSAGSTAFYLAVVKASQFKNPEESKVLKVFLEWALRHGNKLDLQIGRSNVRNQKHCFLPMQPTEKVKDYVRNRLTEGDLASDYYYYYRR